MVLWSPHIRTVPFDLATGTIGVAQSLNLTFGSMPSFSRRYSSTSALGFMAYGTGLALQNFG